MDDLLKVMRQKVLLVQMEIRFSFIQNNHPKICFWEMIILDDFKENNYQLMVSQIRFKHVFLNHKIVYFYLMICPVFLNNFNGICKAVFSQS